MLIILTLNMFGKQNAQCFVFTSIKCDDNNNKAFRRTCPPLVGRDRKHHTVCNLIKTTL